MLHGDMFQAHDGGDSHAWLSHDSMWISFACLLPSPLPAEYISHSIHILYCLCGPQDMTLSRYDPHISFQDPVVRLKGRSAYAANIRLLRALFDIDFVLHKTETRRTDGIVTWCVCWASTQYRHIRYVLDDCHTLKRN